MKITTIYTDQTTTESDHQGCDACNAAREIKRILSNPNVKTITIEVQ
jgi:hypothetical protein